MPLPTWVRPRAWHLGMRIRGGLGPPPLKGRRGAERLRAALGERAEKVGSPLIVLSPSVPWRGPLYQRPQQIARALARAGCSVIYRVPWPNEDRVDGLEEAEDGVILCHTTTGLLPLIERPVVIAYCYTLSRDIRRYRDPLLVYEHIDRLSIFDHYPLWWLKRRHRWLCRHADLVTATSRSLLSEMRPMRPDAALIPNGVDLEHFATAADQRSRRPAPAPEDGFRIGYVGAFESWIDYSLLDRLASARPTDRLILIGPDPQRRLEQTGLLGRPNVEWLGPRAYAEVPDHLAQLDLALVPFLVNDDTRAVSPIKLFEYLAAGLPVITTDLPECQGLPGVSVAGDQDGFLDAVERALVEPGSVDERRRASARHSWDARADLLLRSIEELRGSERK